MHLQPSLPLIADLKAWRLGKARKLGIPAFRILTDRVLLAIAVERPKNLQTLLLVPGAGPALIKNYGVEIMAVIHQTQHISPH